MPESHYTIPIQMRKRRPTLVSVFSGAGGLDLGLESAGFEHLGLIENCALCRASLSLNRKAWPHLEWNDVHEASRKCQSSCLGLERGDLDLLAGAPPCQPFSTAAQWSARSRQGFDDPRATTLNAFLELAAKLLPKVILIENVPSFWTKTFGAEAIIRNSLENIGDREGVRYRLEARVLNAKDYGVPQTRRRVIVVAWRTPGDFGWPERDFEDAPVTAWDALHGIKPSAPPECRGKWAQLLPSIPEGKNYLWHTDRGQGLKLFGYRTKFWSFLLKLAKDKPAWTVAAQPGPGTGPFHWENRPLATEELLALQSFPTTWQLAGNYRDHVRMIGNATPPILAERLGIEIAALLSGKPEKAVPKLRLTIAGTKPTKKAVNSVPESYFPLLRDHDPHPGTGLGPKPRRAVPQND
jgi:DNA (cytosine-5)-methyltransferase 1